MTISDNTGDSERSALRAQGLKPIRIWVPDANAPGVADEARRQAQAIAASSHEAEDQAWVESLMAPSDRP